MIDDLKNRLANHVQLTTDGHSAYLQAVEDAFGIDVDFAQLIKIYGDASAQQGESRYSPAQIVTVKPKHITGVPDPAHISTSMVERHNLTIRFGPGKTSLRLWTPWRPHQARAGHIERGRQTRLRPKTARQRKRPAGTITYA